MHKRLVFLGLMAVLLTLGFFSKDALVCRIVDRKITHFISSLEDFSFAVKEKQRIGNRLVLRGLSLTEKGHHSHPNVLIIKEIEVVSHLCLSKKPLHLSVFIEGADVELVRYGTTPFSTSLKKMIPPRSYWTQTEVAVFDSLVTTEHITDGLTKLETVYLQGKWVHKEGEKELFADLKMGKRRKEKDHFFVHARLSDHNRSVRMKAEQIEVAVLQKLQQFFSCNPNNHWTQLKVTEGQLHGGLSCKIDEQDRIVAWNGQLSLLNTDLHHKGANLRLAADEIVLAALHKNTGFPQANIEVRGDSSLTFFHQSSPYWQLKNFQGGVFFESLKEGVIALSAESLLQEQKAKFRLEGHSFFDPYQLFAHPKGDLSLQFFLTPDQGPESSAHLMAEVSGTDHTTIACNINQLGVLSCRALQTVATHFYPKMEKISLFGGQVSAKVQAEKKQGKWGNVRVVHVGAESLNFLYEPLGIFTKIGMAEGSLHANLSSATPIDTLSGEISLSELELGLDGVQDPSLGLKDGQTTLLIHKGVLCQSVLRGELAGFSGEVLCDWSMPKEFARVEFIGSTADLASFSSKPLSGAALQNLGDHPLLVTASLGVAAEGIGFDGLVELGGQGSEIRFGGVVARPAEKLWGVGSKGQNAARCWAKKCRQFEEILPSIAAPAMVSHHKELLSDIGRSDIAIQQGWLSCSHLDSKKTISAFLFPDGTTELSGDVSVIGSFDMHGVDLEMMAKDVVIDGVGYECRVPALGKGENPCLLSWNSADRSFSGIFPVEKGIYRHINTGFVAEQIDSVVAMKGNEFVLSEAKGTVEGAVVQADLLIHAATAKDPRFSVAVGLKEATLSVLQLQKVLRHFGDWEFLYYPIEGMIQSKKPAGTLVFSGRAGSFSSSIALQASLEKGSFFLPGDGACIQDLHLEIAYDSDTDKLLLLQPTGTFCLQNTSTRYPLVGEGIVFDSLSEKRWSVDCSVIDHQGELLRIAGDAKPDQGSDSLQHFTLDTAVSHIVNNAAFSADVLLDESGGIQDFWWQGPMDLQGSWPRAYPLVHWWTKNWSIRSHEEKIRAFCKQIQVTTVDLDVRKHQGGEIDLDLFFPSVQFKEQVLSPFSVQARIEGSHCTVHQAEVGPVQLAFEVEVQEQKLAIPFLRVDAKPVGWLGSQGSFEIGSGVLDFSVSEFQADLSHLPDAIANHCLVKKINPEGVIQGAGVVLVDFSDPVQPDFRCKMEVTGKDIAVAGWRGAAFQNAGVLYQDNIWQIDHLATYLFCPETQGACPRFQLGHLEIQEDHIQLDQLQYSIPARHLRKVLQTVKDLFPNAIPEDVAEAVKNAKDTGNFVGGVSFFTGPSWWVKGYLADDTYHWLKKEHTVGNAAFFVDAEKMEAAMSYSFLDFDHGLYTKFDFKTDKGVSHLFSLQEDWKEHPITDLQEWSKEDIEQKNCQVDWHLVHGADLYIDQVQGKHKGLTADLVRSKEVDEKTFFGLKGEFLLELPEGLSWVSPSVRQSIVDIGWKGNYHFSGLVLSERKSGENLHLQGDVVGKDCFFQGVYAEKAKARVVASPEQVRVEALTVQDPAGRLAIPEGVCVREDQGWKMEIPHFALREIRPSLLQRKGENKSVDEKTLVIDRLDLHQITGLLHQPSSWKGKGQASFLNPSKKATANTIFAIPADIIARIGLDLDVMTPVSGKIIMHLADARLYLDEFIDVFSDGHISKFYLPDGYTSWVDLSGAVNVTLRMKQYNLIFKLAELFTFRVQGTLENPSYTVQKQPTKTDSVIEDLPLEPTL